MKVVLLGDSCVPDDIAQLGIPWRRGGEHCLRPGDFALMAFDRFDSSLKDKHILRGTFTCCNDPIDKIRKTLANDILVVGKATADPVPPGIEALFGKICYVKCGEKGHTHPRYCCTDGDMWYKKHDFVKEHNKHCGVYFPTKHQNGKPIHYTRPPHGLNSFGSDIQYTHLPEIKNGDPGWLSTGMATAFHFLFDNSMGIPNDTCLYMYRFSHWKDGKVVTPPKGMQNAFGRPPGRHDVNLERKAAEYLHNTKRVFSMEMEHITPDMQAHEPPEYIPAPPRPPQPQPSAKPRRPVPRPPEPAAPPLKSKNNIFHKPVPTRVTQSQISKSPVPSVPPPVKPQSFPQSSSGPVPATKVKQQTKPPPSQPAVKRPDLPCSEPNNMSGFFDSERLATCMLIEKRFGNTPPMTMLDIGCGMGPEAEYFHKKYGTEIWVIEGDAGSPIDQMKRVRTLGWGPPGDFKFAVSSVELQNSFKERGISATFLPPLDVKRPDLPKFDLIFSKAACGMHFPISSYGQLMRSVRGNDTRVILELNQHQKIQHRKDGAIIKMSLKQNKRSILAEIRLI